MTIARRPVTDAFLALLRTTGFAVGDGIAPDAAGQQYAVLEPLDTTADGSPFVPEREYYFGYRLRSVGQDQASTSGHTNPRMDAEGVDDALRAVVFNRGTLIQGSGWRAIRRVLLGAGTDREGPTVNVITDVQLVVVAR